MDACVVIAEVVLIEIKADNSETLTVMEEPLSSTKPSVSSGLVKS